MKEYRMDVWPVELGIKQELTTKDRAKGEKCVKKEGVVSPSFSVLLGSARFCKVTPAQPAPGGWTLRYLPAFYACWHTLPDSLPNELSWYKINAAWGSHAVQAVRD